MNNEGRTVQWQLNGTDQRAAALLQSLPVISSAPAVVMKMLPASFSFPPCGHASEDKIPARNGTLLLSRLELTLRNRSSGLPPHRA
jgi:hypothetical protein